MTESSPPPGPVEPPGDAAPLARRGDVAYGAEAPVEPARAAGPDERETAAPGFVFPWPPASDTGVVDAFVRTWQGSSFQPSAFFRALPKHDSLGAALLYYLPLGILIAGAELFWKLMRTSSTTDTTLGSLGTGAAVHPLVWFLVSPVLLLLSLFLSAAVTHALLKLFGGASHDFTTTARVFAFAYSPMIFGVVPVVGAAIGFIWMVVIAIIGLRDVHGTSSGRAVAAVLIPVLLALVLLALAYLVRAAGTLLDMPL